MDTCRKAVPSSGFATIDLEQGLRLIAPITLYNSRRSCRRIYQIIPGLRMIFTAREWTRWRRDTDRFAPKTSDVQAAVSIKRGPLSSGVSDSKY